MSTPFTENRAIGPDAGDERAAPRSSIGCIVAAHNEEASIAGVIASLLGQTRVPDVIHVVVSNTTDDTVRVASTFAGPHETVTDLGDQFTEVFIHDIGKNSDEKVGALNYGYSLVEGCDYLLGVGSDTIGDERAVQFLETEATSDSRIGGVSAMLPCGRSGAVLSEHFCIFSTTALRAVMEANHQPAPWVRDSEVEDLLLSLQIESAGYLAKFSLNAHADVGGYTV